MTTRPVFQKEGPASSCVIDGHYLGWKNCTCLSFAMGIDRSTKGRVRLTGCMVRGEILPKDVDGGTTIEQNARVADLHGVNVEVHTGGDLASQYMVGIALQAGRGVSIAGNQSALGGRNVNHQAWLNEPNGGTLGHPEQVLTYDADSNGPAWWTWSKVMAFAHALHPWGEGDPRTLASLGISGVYAGIFPDTEGPIWGTGISSAIKALDPDGRIVGDAVHEAGHNYGTLIDYSDLVAAMNKLHHNYGAVVDASDVHWLLAWATKH